ncbi:alpha/beta hydrolase [Thalassotalea agariperforans]
MAVLRLEKSNPDYSRKNTTTFTIHSSYLQSRHDVSVYHQSSDNKDIPIVVLLHGVYGSHWVWMDLGGVHLVYEQLRAQGLSEFILVMPSDGGLWDGSGYLPLNEHGNYDGWIVDDVINTVKANIDQASENSPVYISGLSMGGYGALRLGVKYPDIFSGISAHSSVTSLADLQQFIENPVDDYQCQDEQEANLSYWLTKNSHTLPPIRFDCGTDDTLYQSNLSLVNTMTELAIPHDFEALAGAHEWPYWHKNVAKTLQFFHQLETQKR